MEPCCRRPVGVLLLTWTALITGCGGGEDDLVVTFDGLIEEIRVDRAEVCFGHPVHVSVTTTVDAQVFIDGVPGASATLSILGPIPQRTIQVRASADGQPAEIQQVTVDVVTCETPWIAVFGAQNPFRRYTVDFYAFSPAWVTPPDVYSWDFGDGQSATTETPHVSHDYRPAMALTEQYSTFPVAVLGDDFVGATETVALQSATWVAKSMGYLATEVYCGQPGTSLTDVLPDPGRGEGDDALVVGGTNGGTPSEAWIPTIDLPRADASLDLVRTIQVYNPHETSITFDRFRRVYKPCDPTQPVQWTDIDAHRLFGDPLLPDLQPFGFPVDLLTQDYGEITSAGEIGVPAGETVTGELVIAASSVPEDVCTVGYYVLGHADAGTVSPAVGSCFVELKDNRVTTEHVTDPETRAAIAQILQDNDLDALSAQAVDQLVRHDVLRRTVGGLEVTP